MANQVYTFDAEKVTNECVNWVRTFFEKNGKDCNAVIGISGGKDSSIVAAICVKALGKERVIGVLMPNGEQHDIDSSIELVNFLGIQSKTINIAAAYNGILNEFDITPSEQTKINLAPRLRMTALYAVSQSNNGRVAKTSNLSETVISWETRWGDAVGDFAPIANLTVYEVKEIGRCLKLPDYLIDKIPSDGLCGATDEEAIGILYSDIDNCIRNPEAYQYITDETRQRIKEKYYASEFKRNPIPAYQCQYLINYLQL